MTTNATASVVSTDSQNNLLQQAKKIAIFGEVLADIFSDETVLGGAPYNVARHLRGFGQYPVLITRVGRDALSDAFLKELNLLKMDDSGVQLDLVHPTGKVTVHMQAQGHHFEIENNQAYDHINAEATHQTMLVAQPDLAYFGTLAQRNTESQSAMGIFLEDAKCPKFLDMNLRPPWVDQQCISRSLFAANILKLNEEELTIVADMFDCHHRDHHAQAAFLVEKFNLELLLITCGESGAWALLSSGEKISVEGISVGYAMIDTVGAGDGFSAVCILGLLNQWPIETLLTRANRFASAICQIRGAAPSTQNFYKVFIEDWI